MVPYLQSLHLKRDEPGSGFGINVYGFYHLSCSLLHHNPMSGVTLDYRLSFAALLAALIGMWLGKKIRYRLNEQLFRRIFFIGLVSLGLYMILH